MAKVTRIGRHWARLDDGTLWSFDDLGDDSHCLNWILRYGSDADVDQEGDG